MFSVPKYFHEHEDVMTWKMIFTLLAPCVGNPPVTGGFSSQSGMQSFVFFLVIRNMLLYKYLICQWTEMSWRSCHKLNNALQAFHTNPGPTWGFPHIKCLNDKMKHFHIFIRLHSNGLVQECGISIANALGIPVLHYAIRMLLNVLNSLA